MSKPLCIDLFCGLGGWTEGFLAEGYRVIGFDVEAHRYPRCVRSESSVKRPGLNWSDRSKTGSKDAQFNRPPALDGSGEWEEYPGELVIQDVLTLHGRQFRDAAVIVASPPCQAYSYRAMPWKRAKALPPPSNELFDACFRIQREASEAGGRHIPLVVENVKGAQPWVGRAKGHFGSYYLWGDVESVGGRICALRPRFGQTIWPAKARKVMSAYAGSGSWKSIDGLDWRDPANVGSKVPGMNFHDHEKGLPGRSFQTAVDTFGWSKDTPLRNNNSHSSARKAASAQIAKIPFPLASYIARVFKP